MWCRGGGTSDGYAALLQWYLGMLRRRRGAAVACSFQTPLCSLGSWLSPLCGSFPLLDRRDPAWSHTFLMSIYTSLRVLATGGIGIRCGSGPQAGWRQHLQATSLGSKTCVSSRSAFDAAVVGSATFRCPMVRLCHSKHEQYITNIDCVPAFEHSVVTREPYRLLILLCAQSPVHFLKPARLPPSAR